MNQEQDLNINVSNIYNEFTLSPGYISGLTQSDGSFFCSISLSSRHRFGIQFRPRFTITADLDSKHVLKSIKLFFNCGKIFVNEKNYTAELLIEKIEDLYSIIIPHFINYPVFCGKLHAFKFFKEIVEALYFKEKRTIEGRRDLLKLALSMNVSSNRDIDRVKILCSLLKMEPHESENYINLLLDSQKAFSADKKILDANIALLSKDHIAGIIDGDGSFYVSFQTDGNIKTGFNITNDKNSKSLLENIQKQLKNIGSIQEGTKNELVYTVNGINQITDVLIPFMDSNPIFSEKAIHYRKFRFVSLMLKNEKILTLEKKLNIVEMAYNMNKKGKRRMMNKLEYIELLKKMK